MPMQRKRERAAFSQRELYNAAVQLYNQEFRTLGERATAFLIVQSILIAAFVSVLANPEWLLYVSELILYGIAIIGILSCISYHLAGRAGSEAAFAWRQYMRYIEHGQEDTPWNWVCNFWDEEHKKHGEPPQKRKVYTWLRSFISRSQCDRCLLERPPLPTVWIATPFMFLMIWFAASVYSSISIGFLIIGDRAFLSLLLLPPAASFSISTFLSVCALGALLLVMYNWKVWWKTRTN